MAHQSVGKALDSALAAANLGAKECSIAAVMNGTRVGDLVYGTLMSDHGNNGLLLKTGVVRAGAITAS